MAGKNVWLTWMASGEDAPNPQEAAAGLTKNGLGVTGGAWPVEVEKHTWVDMASQLIEEEGVDLWVICGRKAELIESERFRYALSLCAAMVRDQRKGKPLQEVIVGLDFAPEAEGLPTLFRSCHLVDGSKGALAAKVVIAAHGGKQGLPPREEWRLNVIAHQLIGQYLEVENDTPDRIKAAPRYPADAAVLSRLVAAAFGQRRKMVRASLRGLAPAIEAHLEAAGIAPTARPEEIGLEAFCALARSLARADDG